MADILLCVVAVWRIRTHLGRVSALIGGFLDRTAVHCQHPEKQHYKRYRSLPYPQLVSTLLLLQTRTVKKNVPTPQNPVNPNNRKTKNDRTKALKTKRKDVNSKMATAITKGVQPMGKKKKILLRKKV